MTLKLITGVGVVRGEMTPWNSRLICRDQTSVLKFRLAPVFLSKKSKIDRKHKLNIPAKNEVILNLDEKMHDYENIYKIGKIGVISKIKERVIQSMIQIDRPVNWTKENILKLANELKWVEMYNAKMLNKLEETKSKWITV
jgi:hypothetical protein